MLMGNIFDQTFTVMLILAEYVFIVPDSIIWNTYFRIPCIYMIYTIYM